MRSALTLATIAALTLASNAAFAQAGHGGHGSDHASMNSSAGAAATFSTGTVRKVDAAANKLTIAHGPLENLGMPSMTMVFTLADTASLDGVAAGDKIRFVADKVDDSFTVITLERAN